MPLPDDVLSVIVTEKEEQDLLGEPPASTHGVPSTSSGDHSALQQLVPVMAQIAESLKALGKTPPPPPPPPRPAATSGDHPTKTLKRAREESLSSDEEDEINGCFAPPSKEEDEGGDGPEPSWLQAYQDDLESEDTGPSLQSTEVLKLARKRFRKKLAIRKNYRAARDGQPTRKLRFSSGAKDELGDLGETENR